MLYYLDTPFFIFVFVLLSTINVNSQFAYTINIAEDKPDKETNIKIRFNHLHYQEQRIISNNFQSTFNRLTLPRSNLANIYLFNVNNRNTRKRCEICSKLTTKTPERRH